MKYLNRKLFKKNLKTFFFALLNFPVLHHPAEDVIQPLGGALVGIKQKLGRDARLVDGRGVDAEGVVARFVVRSCDVAHQLPLLTRARQNVHH